jgi:hypothetical protein
MVRTNKFPHKPFTLLIKSSHMYTTEYLNYKSLSQTKCVINILINIRN